MPPARVIVKYIARTTNLRITPKHKVVFYASQGSKEVVGEGVIEATEFFTPKEVLEKYGDKVFLSEGELMEYTMREPKRTFSKKMLTLILSKLRLYTQPIKYGRPVTMAGEYLTEEKCGVLLQKVSKENL